MLAAGGIISEAERDELHRGLEQVRRELADGSFPFADGDEDIQMAIERRLAEVAGLVGGRAPAGSAESTTRRARATTRSRPTWRCSSGRTPPRRSNGSPASPARWST